MPPSEPIDPRESMAALLAYEMRRQREARGLTQDQFAKELYTTRATIQAYESRRNRPDEEFCVRLDQFFGTGVLFQTLWYHGQKEHLKQWLRLFFSHERESSQIRSFQPMNIPGLLQTESYMRAAAKNMDAEDVIAERLARREILTRSQDPPYFWAVLDEVALRRPVGGPTVMGEQLQHLLDMSALPRITIQVVPERAGWHPGMDGALVILAKAQGKSVGYVEAQFGGRLIEDPAELTSLGVLYDQVRAKALSEDDSYLLTRRTMEAMNEGSVAQEQSQPGRPGRVR